LTKLDIFCFEKISEIQDGRIESNTVWPPRERCRLADFVFRFTYFWTWCHAITSYAAPPIRVILEERSYLIVCGRRFCAIMDACCYQFGSFRRRSAITMRLDMRKLCRCQAHGNTAFTL